MLISNRRKITLILAFSLIFVTFSSCLFYSESSWILSDNLRVTVTTTALSTTATTRATTTTTSTPRPRRRMRSGPRTLKRTREAITWCKPLVYRAQKTGARWRVTYECARVMTLNIEQQKRHHLFII